MARLGSENAPLFRFQSLRAGYAEKAILKGLDGEIAAGEAFAVLGPSGEGKTLLLKVLAGLVPYRGTLEFEGREVRTLNRPERKVLRESLAMTFQKDGLFDSLTCGDNLRFPLNERLKLGRKEREKRVESALEDVGLKGQSRLFVHEMSGGMQKRLGIARALLFSPRVVLYDEPAAGLDPITARSINDLILSMRDKYAMTLVLVTSDLLQARQLCTRMALLWKGAFEQVGSFTALKQSSNPAARQFFSAQAQGPLTEAGV